MTPEIQLVLRRQVWQIEMYYPQDQRRTLVPPRYYSIEKAQEAYNHLLETLRMPQRGKKLREYLLTHPAHAYSTAPTVIREKSEIQY